MLRRDIKKIFLQLIIYEGEIDSSAKISSLMIYGFPIEYMLFFRVSVIKIYESYMKIYQKYTRRER